MTTPDVAPSRCSSVREGKDRHCDRIVIGKQGRSALGEFLLGSVARLVVEETRRRAGLRETVGTSA